MMHFKSKVAAASAAIILTSAAAADFTGWSYEIAGTADSPGEIGFWAFRLFATFSSPGDRLLSVIDANYTNAGEQQFYQNPFGSGVEPLPSLIPVFPDLKWDSYVTIGHRALVLGQPATSLDPDGEWTAAGFTGGYFVPGDAPQGLAGFSLKVLIAQLTIQNPTATAGVAGTATIAWESAAGGGTQFSEIEFAPLLGGPIPAPAALPLLAIAGLADSRRRR